MAEEGLEELRFAFDHDGSTVWLGHELPIAPTWVGQFELTAGTEILPVLRPAATSDEIARVWIRRDGVPLGHCEIPMNGGIPDGESLRKTVASRFALSGDANSFA